MTKIKWKPKTIRFCLACGLMALKKQKKCPRCSSFKYTYEAPKAKDILTKQNIILSQKGKIVCLH